jgi:NAD(P)-dependent dehydrogenase (short-subunit alcohol dehydrogenase family)
MSTYKLVNKVVAITGSTGGLGSALAEALYARGAVSHFSIWRQTEGRPGFVNFSPKMV